MLAATAVILESWGLGGLEQFLECAYSKIHIRESEWVLQSCTTVFIFLPIVDWTCCGGQKISFHTNDWDCYSNQNKPNEPCKPRTRSPGISVEAWTLFLVACQASVKWTWRLYLNCRHMIVPSNKLHPWPRSPGSSVDAYAQTKIRQRTTRVDCGLWTPCFELIVAAGPHAFSTHVGWLSVYMG